MRRLLSPVRLLAAGAILGVITLGILWFTPSDSYLLLPDRARAVAPLITVKGGKTPKGPGGIYFVNVIVRRATLFEELFPGIREGSSLVHEDRINPPGVNEETRRQADLHTMARSQDIAAAVALRTLGYRVVANAAGALITEIRGGLPAEGELRLGETIVAVDGQPVRTPTDLRRLILRHKPGDEVRLQLRSPKGLRQVTLRTAADPERPSRPVIGVIVGQAAEIKLPFPVRIRTGSIGGPSAGLAFALGLMEQLGKDIDKGLKVAATGELSLDGSVGPIGAVRQKTLDARKSRVDVFLVPAGDNAQEARRYAEDLRVVPVKSFRQALQALATLSPPT